MCGQSWIIRQEPVCLCGCNLPHVPNALSRGASAIGTSSLGSCPGVKFRLVLLLVSRGEEPPVSTELVVSLQSLAHRYDGDQHCIRGRQSCGAKRSRLSRCYLTLMKSGVRVTAQGQLTFAVGPVVLGCGLYIPPHLPLTDRRPPAEITLAHRGVACCRLYGTRRGLKAWCNCFFWKLRRPCSRLRKLSADVQQAYRHYRHPAPSSGTPQEDNILRAIVDWFSEGTYCALFHGLGAVYTLRSVHE